MYSKLPNLVLGFHGCHQNTFRSVVHNSEQLRQSSNSYDWLGNGIYFWEQNYQRAFEWAVNRYGENDAAVIGAVIDLGKCLNLTDIAATGILRNGYQILKVRCKITGEPLPKNRPSYKSTDILLRDLDCAVIEQVHDFNKETNQESFDSVRGIFVEGGRVYDGSEFYEKTHVQLCIRNPNCIKGYFSPLSPNRNFSMP